MKRFIILSCFLAACGSVRAAVVIDSSDADFFKQVTNELSAMRQGERGVVCKALVNRLDAATSTTTIRPLTRDESTWHPNDRRGTRSHVVPLDTKVRGAERGIPTSAILYLHPSRIDPHMSLYRLGTFVHELSNAVDLNTGHFSGDFKIREKRAVFFRNAWCDSLGYNLIDVSDRVATPEYSEAKAHALLTETNSEAFPILNFPSR